MPRAALDIPRHGWVNLHFSLLPAWRGAAPVQHALLAGDEVTGATTFLLEEGLDTGPVLGVLTEQVRPTDTSGDLLARLAEAGAGLLVATLDGIEAGAPDGRAAARRGRVARAEDHGRGRPGRLDRARAAGRPPGPCLHPRPGRLDHLPRQAGQARPRRRAIDAGWHPGVLDGDLVGTGTHAVRLGPVRPEGKGDMAAGDWLRGLRPDAGGGLP